MEGRKWGSRKRIKTSKSSIAFDKKRSWFQKRKTSKGPLRRTKKSMVLEGGMITDASLEGVLDHKRL